jgi:hypothetical protein
MKIYVIAPSEANALNQMTAARYYVNLDDAKADLADFGRRGEKIYEIHIPIMEVLNDPIS